jgi:hypothetical protein
LQKGLLTKDSPPKEEEMKPIHDFFTKLEGYPELEVTTIRATKINKVLKAILKLEEIPKEGEYNFKSRCTGLLDQWNKIIDAANANGAPAMPAASTNDEAATGGTAPSVEKDVGDSVSATANNDEQVKSADTPPTGKNDAPKSDIAPSVDEDAAAKPANTAQVEPNAEKTETGIEPAKEESKVR